MSDTPRPTVSSSTAAAFPANWDPAVNCPNCGAAGMRRFYDVRDIPVHSVLQMPDRETALAYPRHDLRLAFCPGCGFVANSVFDPSYNEYSPEYEETQGFSPTFNAFARTLAREVVDRYDLRGKTILEIGCGKGDFLAFMCETGDCRGIGLDPAYRPDRRPREATSRVEFIQDYYDERYAHLQADCIVCRHTLEHIGPTQEFMRNVRRTVGDRSDTIIFFELPDVTRELREGAFWDLYYEHCSYFSPGSLARLFRSVGFCPIELSTAYDNQYILIAAKPGDPATAPALPLEDDLGRLRRDVEDFATVCAATIGRWRDYIDRNADRRIVIWGSGSKGVSFLTTLRVGSEIELVVDINPHRQGKFMAGTGHPIVGPAALAEYEPGCVIVMNPVYVEEITGELAKMGLKPEVVAV